MIQKGDSQDMVKEFHGNSGDTMFRNNLEKGFEYE
jgi:hypothetical protein